MWEDWTTAPWPAKEVLESCEEIRVLERKLPASGQHEVCQLRPWQAGSKVSKLEGFFFFSSTTLALRGHPREGGGPPAVPTAPV